MAAGCRGGPGLSLQPSPGRARGAGKCERGAAKAARGSTRNVLSDQACLYGRVFRLTSPSRTVEAAPCLLRLESAEGLAQCQTPGVQGVSADLSVPCSPEGQVAARGSRAGMEAFSASRFEAWADQLPEDPSPAPGSAHGHQSPPAPDRVSAPPSPSSPVPEEDGLRSREAPGEDPLGSSSSARAGDGEPVLLGDATSLDGAANGGLSQTGTLSSEQGRGDTWDRGETEERTEAGESRETGERGENEWPIPGEGSGQGVETGQQENSGLGEEIGHRREDSTWHEGLQEAPRRNPSAAQGAVPGPEACNHDQDQAGPPRDTEGQGQDKEDGSDTTPVPAEGAGPAPSSASLERFANGEEKVERREGKDHPSLEQEVSALEKVSWPLHAPAPGTQVPLLLTGICGRTDNDMKQGSYGMGRYPLGTPSPSSLALLLTCSPSSSALSSCSSVPLSSLPVLPLFPFLIRTLRAGCPGRVPGCGPCAVAAGGAGAGAEAPCGQPGRGGQAQRGRDPAVSRWELPRPHPSAHGMPWRHLSLLGVFLCLDSACSYPVFPYRHLHQTIQEGTH